MAPHNFTPVLTHLLLTSLSDHRHDTNSTVIDRVLNSNFNSLNTLFNFEISSCIIRRSVIFYIPVYHSNFGRTNHFIAVCYNLIRTISFLFLKY